MSQPVGPEMRHSLQGRYDALRTVELEQELERLFSLEPSTVLLDLGNVTYLGSSAIRILLLANRRAVAGGAKLVLANVPPNILGVLRMAGLHRLFDLSP